MLWEVEIVPLSSQQDRTGRAVETDARDLGIAENLTARFSFGYLIQGNLDRDQLQTLADRLLADTVVERTVITLLWKEGDEEGNAVDTTGGTFRVYVLPKPGVTDAVAESAKKAIADFGKEFDERTEAIRTFKKYRLSEIDRDALDRLCTKLLANDAIEQVVLGNIPFTHLQLGNPYDFRLKHVAMSRMDDAALQKLSKEGQLYLSLPEMRTIRDFFAARRRDPTDVELETIAQTWSEHCSHKTLAGKIEYTDPQGTRRFENMLKETIFAATAAIRDSWKRRGKEDICVSVFADNAGVVRFDENDNVCFKVETHNHPSALEPYGGANTGLGGVIRDPMGTGMGAKPICSTDVFCFAPPEIAPEELPGGVLHPRRIMRGVVSGVRDYGNRMGIPTVNGAVYFDKRYLGNPLVFCGNVGILPREKSFKEAKPGDLIVALGGKTGRDGIHGATFSSAELTSESETLSGGAVQIGNAITEKIVLDVMLQARDRNLYNAVTDCGAGGFSSAVGEMGEHIGAEVALENIPLKYEGLSYTEMWISEAQERMVFAVPAEKWAELRELCDSEGVEATVIGEFKPTGRLVLLYEGTKVADLEMSFLHDGRPAVVRQARYTPPQMRPLVPDSPKKEDLYNILSSLNVASKHWIIRQYDHEVQGGSVVKPLLGANNDGPGDAAVVRPRLGSDRGIAISCGMNPHYGDYDTYHMAASAIDEAVRNCVAVGADPQTISILDNFCWGNTDRPETLGSLVRSAIACYDVSTAWETPFISGKDSLNNEFRPEGAEYPVSIPPSLLISALGHLENVALATTMDLKEPGNVLYQVGRTKNELGGSHWALVRGWAEQRLGQVPTVDVHEAKHVFAAVHEAIRGGMLRSVHDLSEGGLAVAVAEACFAGNLGADIDLAAVVASFGEDDLSDDMSEDARDTLALFSESNSRFLVEVAPEHLASFESLMRRGNVQALPLGKVVSQTYLTIRSASGAVLFREEISALKSAWIQPLDW